MTKMKITNPVIYACPSDSDSDSEPVKKSFPLPPRKRSYRHYDRYLQQQNMLKIGCTPDILDEYKEIIRNQKVLTYDPTFEVNFKKHLQKLKEERIKRSKEERAKHQEEFKKLQAHLKTLYINVPSDEDTRKFEEELKKEQDDLKKAITYERKKVEDQTAKAKANEEAKAAADAKAKADADAKEKKDQEQKEQNQKLMNQKKSAATSIKGLEEYEKYYAKIERYKKEIRPMLEDPTFRKQCFEARKIVKRTVSQLQYKHNVIIEKYNTLNNHLLSVKQQSPQAFEVMLNFLAKTFLLQARQEIHATPFAAYFLGRFAYLLCATIPEFTDYLLGRLMKRCQYLIPRYHDDDSSLSQDEIKSRLRYAYANKEKKILQSFLQHAEQQKCYVMFYAGLCQSVPDGPNEPQNPIPIKHAWVWLARICNMPPREITPMLLMGMLEITTKRLLVEYPNQTPKLLRMIQNDVLPRLPKDSAGDNLATIKRLEMFLNAYFTTGVPDCVPEVPPS